MVSWVLTAYLLSASIATPLIGRLGDMYGKERLLVVVLVLLCVATVFSALATYLAALLLGAGIGFAFAAMVNLIIENVGPTETGVATGDANGRWRVRGGRRRLDPRLHRRSQWPYPRAA